MDVKGGTVEKMRTAVTLVACLLLAAAALAQGPPRVTHFSGIVRDAAGVPQTGVYNLTFSIYSQAEGGTALWSEVQVVTLGADGRYSVLLGATTTGGLPLDIFVSGEARWLGVQVNSEMEAARVALVSVPYALKSGDTDTIGGRPLSAFILAGETTGVGSDGLTYLNSSLLEAGQSPFVNSTGSAGYLGVFTDSANLGNSVAFQVGSKIGIGTTTPSELLTVGAANGVLPGPSVRIRGDAVGDGAGHFYGSYGSLLLNANPTFTSQARRYLLTNALNLGSFAVIRSQDATTDPTLGTAGAVTSGVVDFAITNSGRVGIGTSAPAELLTIGAPTGTVPGPPVRVRGEAVSDGAGHYYGSYGSVLLNANPGFTTAARRFLVTNALNLNSFAVIRSADANTDPGLGANGALASGAADLVISNTGKVGIGTTSPAQLLTIGPATGAAAGPTVRIQGDALPDGAGHNYGSYGSLLLNANSVLTSGARRFLLTNGLNTNTFGVIRSADANTDPTLGASGNLTSGTVDLAISGSGNVGIGTAAPLAKLHVAGDVIVDGNIGAKYQDVAEWVDADGPLDDGTLVVVDVDARNQVESSTQPYDTRVAGAVSAQPGLVLGERRAGRVLVAQSGRVRIKVDAGYGAIAAGDLLVSSPTPGHAMKSTPVVVGGIVMHRPGTLVGKALEPLSSGRGSILVLLTLQ